MLLAFQLNNMYGRSTALHSRTSCDYHLALRHSVSCRHDDRGVTDGRLANKDLQSMRIVQIAWIHPATS